MGRTERGLRQLSYLGVFDEIKGLIIGKPEFFNGDDAPFSYEDLFMEIIGPRSYPIVSRFDCGHTLPMLTIPQHASVKLMANRTQGVAFEFLGSGVDLQSR